MTAVGDVQEVARGQAAAAAGEAGVAITEATSARDVHAVSRLFELIWQAPPDAGPVRPGTMIAARHVGAQVSLAHAAGGNLVAATFAFHGADGHLHSHVTGVAPEATGRGVGRALKLHQRAWALQRGITQISWTYDPLVRRNAWFNLARLGVELTSYLPDFYGEMPDGINAGDATDRAFVVWRIDRDLPATARTRPLPAAWVVRVEDDRPRLDLDALDLDGPVGIQVPEDIEVLRRDAPQLASVWRAAVREAFVTGTRAGRTVVGVTRQADYVLSGRP